MKYNSICFVVLLFLVGCQSGNSISGEMIFSRADFKENKVMENPEEIVMEDLLYPASFRVMYDSILVVGNQSVCDYQLELYSLNTLKPIKQLITKGNGPNEMFSCGLMLHTNQDKAFYLQDSNAGVCYVTDMKSLLANAVFTPLDKFRYSSEILNTTDICLMGDNRYVGYHMWYLEDKDFSPVESPLAYYAYNDNSGKGMQDFPYFVASVTGARFFKNPKTGQIWTLDFYRDRIQVYDDSLKVVASMEGPDRFNPSYTKRAINAPVSFVAFEGGLYYAAYTDYYLTDKHIYVVYQGTKSFNPQELPAVEIFKLDFDGNLLCNYKFDRYVYSVSVDSKERYMYVASRKSVDEPPVILRYEL